jgi:hypothetical protein
MAEKGNDPAELWRTMLGEMEKGFNAFANQAMTTPQFSQAMNQAGNASADAQRQVGELMGKYLAGLNMPSRDQMIAYGERLQAIESDVAEIKALVRALARQAGVEEGGPDTPKPARTRKPPSKERPDDGGAS